MSLVETLDTVGGFSPQFSGQIDPANERGGHDLVQITPSPAGAQLARAVVARFRERSDAEAVAAQLAPTVAADVRFEIVAVR